MTVENALAWARLPTSGSGSWWAFRISAVRGFATYLHALDDRHEVPPADVLARRIRRAVPYLYTEQEIWALMVATDQLRGRLRRATYRTLIGLLAVTGMRVGEAIRLDRADLDLAAGVVTVRETQVRQVTRAAAAPHDRHRAARVPADPRRASARGRQRRGVDLAGRDPADLLQRARDLSPALEPTPGCGHGRRRAARRIHDLRHRFAVQTLLDWYRDGVEVQPRLPLLCTYMGHIHPRRTRTGICRRRRS